MPMTRNREEPSTSQRLLVQTKLGIETAQQRIYEIYHPLVYAWARSAGLQSHDALDICQQTFIKLYASIASYRPEKSRFRAWLWTIVKNQILDFVRKKKRYDNLLTEFQELGLAEPPEASAAKIPGIVAARALELLESGLGRKTFKMAQAVLILGQDPASVAADFATSTAAVYTAKSRALKLLRETLTDLEMIGNES